MATHKWKDVKRRHHTEEQLAEVESEARRELEVEELVAKDLAALRAFAEKTQVEAAKAQGVTQPRISKLESMPLESVLLSTIQRYVEALGGTLELTAKFGKREIHLKPEALSQARKISGTQARPSST